MGGEGITKREMSVEELKMLLNQTDNYIKELSKENAELKERLRNAYDQLKDKSIDVAFNVISMCSKNEKLNIILDPAVKSAYNILNFYLINVDPTNTNDPDSTNEIESDTTTT